jgi:nicotinamidase-related amidase
VETSLREPFNIGYDVVFISDATASSNYKHYESTLENVRLLWTSDGFGGDITISASVSSGANSNA